MSWKSIKDCPKEFKIRKMKCNDIEFDGTWMDGAGWVAYVPVNSDPEGEGILPASPDYYWED